MKLRFGLLIVAFAFLMSAQQAGLWRGGVVTPPLPKPGFVLTDTSGAAFDFKQQYLMMTRSTQRFTSACFFQHSHCSDL